MIGVVSDIHGNITALDAVLDDMPSSVDTIICCGDVVGYGPRPKECVSRVRECVDICVQGNHDKQVLSKGTYNSAGAAEGINYAKQELHSDDFGWLSRLKATEMCGFYGPSWEITHAAPDEYTSERTYPHLYQQDANIIASHTHGDVFLFGHTHVPFTKTVDDTLIVNPGSVGQPRDGNPKASYALINDKKVAEVNRVMYDIDKTVSQIHDAELPEDSASRIRIGE